MTAPRDARPAPDTATLRPAAKTDTESGTVKSNNDRWDADDDAWRHAPVAPVDESAAKSLGRAVTDAVVTGADPANAGKPSKP